MLGNSPISASPISATVTVARFPLGGTVNAISNTFGFLFDPSVFPNIVPDYTSIPSVLLRARRQGRSYTERNTDGINSKRITWNLIFNNLNNSDSLELTEFIKGRKGYNHILWISPNDTQVRKWLCNSIVGPTPSGYQMSNVALTLVEYFG